MKVYAHRGASIELPENTLAAFARGIEVGAEGIELDVYRAADGTAVVIHDATLDRTTNGTGPVTERTAVELAGLDAGGGEKVPTLEEVLTLAAGKARVNIEIKDPDAVDAVLEVTSRIEGLDWFASGAPWEALKDLHERGGAPIYPLSMGAPENVSALIAKHPDRAEQIAASAHDWTETVAWAQQVGAEGLSIYHEGLTAEIVAAIHDAGLQVWAWTVNDPERASELAATGIDGICTDAPAEVLAARAAAV